MIYDIWYNAYMIMELFNNAFQPEIEMFQDLK